MSQLSHLGCQYGAGSPHYFDPLEKLENNSAKALAVAGPMRILRLLDEASPRWLSAPLAVSDVV